MINKQKAKQIEEYLTSMITKTDEGYELIGEKWIDDEIFTLIYQLDGISSGMYD